MKFHTLIEFAAAVTRVLEHHDSLEDGVEPERLRHFWEADAWPTAAAAEEICPGRGKPGWVDAITRCQACITRENTIATMSRGR